MKKTVSILIIVIFHAFTNLLPMDPIQINLAQLNQSLGSLKTKLQMLSEKLTKLKGTLEKSTQREAWASIYNKFNGICWEKLPTGGFKIAPARNFNKTFIESLDDNDLKTAFPYLEKKHEIKSFINNLLICYRDAIKSGLSWCPCIVAQPAKRFLLIICQVNAILEKYPDLNNQIVHFEIGEQQGMQSYLLANALKLVGYKNIHLVALNVIHCNEYPILESKINELKKDTKGNQMDTFEITITTYHPAAGTKRIDKTVYDKYIADLKSNKEPKIHSIGITDPTDKSGLHNILVDLGTLLKENINIDENTVIYSLLENITRHTI